MPSCWMPKATPASLRREVWSQDGKLKMTVYTSAPALQFYSGNYLGGTPSQTDGALRRLAGAGAGERIPAGFAESSEWPQPDCVLRPGQEYVSLTEYQFIAC
ncbi:hypothetical protein LNO81_07960 [Klebsiella variicola subsp. variicola]|nr:hypothetical protein [Klebsiella variicola subsp. variicola]